MSVINQFAVRAIIPVAVAVGFALARKYVKPSAQLSATQLAVLDKRFARTRWMVGGGMVVVGTAFVWLTHYVLLVLNRRLAAGDASGTSFWLWPQSAIWWFFPGIGALTLCWDITLLIWSTFGHTSTAKLYRNWSDGRSGVDSTRILRWMTLVIAAPIGVVTVLALPMHTAVREQDVRVCGYAWAECKTFEYSKAVRLTQIEGFRNRSGKLKRQAGIVVDFADGQRWSSADMGEFRNGVDPAFSAFLVERTRLQLERAETEADIPQLNGIRQSRRDN